MNTQKAARTVKPKRVAPYKRAVKSGRAAPAKRATLAERSAQPHCAVPPGPVELASRMTIVQAADLHRALLARLAGGESIVVDGTRVEEIDTAILQLLASLWRTARERGTACTWHGASEILRQTASLIGVAEVLHFPNGESAKGRGNAAD